MAVICTLGAWAQEPAPRGIVRGTVLEHGAEAAGEVVVRGAGNRVLRLQYDARTYAERDGRRIAPRELANGDQVEIVSDDGLSEGSRYARSIRVLPPEAAPQRVRSRLYRPEGNWFDTIYPRGDRTYSGTIAELAAGSLVVRTAGNQATRIRLREDTRFLAQGSEASLADLQMNTRVFVRAGKSFDGEIEAYQVIWGAIFSPRD